MLGVGDSDRDAAQVYDLNGGIVLPGLIDGHVHIERSLLTSALVSRSRITGPIVLGQGSLLRPAH